MKKNYIIVHGSFGNPNENWFPWLCDYITSNIGKCLVPQFPINEKQNYNNWKIVFDELKNNGLITPNTTIITHSIASIFVVKWVVETKTEIEKLISVSGFNNHRLIKKFDDVNESFFVEDYLTIESFKQYCKNRICFISNNDPYIPLNKLTEFSTLIAAETIMVENAGHFNEAAGFLKFNEILKLI